MPTALPKACKRPLMKPTAAAKNNWLTMRSTVLLRSRLKRARNAALLGTGNTNADDEVKVPKAYVEPSNGSIAADPVVQYMSKPQMEKAIERTRKLMQEAARKLEFIEAAQYRDELLKMEENDERTLVRLESHHQFHYEFVLLRFFSQR